MDYILVIILVLLDKLGCYVKMTGVKLEKISDIEKYLFIEK